MRRLAALLATAAAASASQVDGHAVEGKIKLPLKLLQEGDLRTTEVTLNGGEHRAFTRPDGSRSAFLMSRRACTCSMCYRRSTSSPVQA